jgi:hypothetical protein
LKEKNPEEENNCLQQGKQLWYLSLIGSQWSTWLFVQHCHRQCVARSSLRCNMHWTSCQTLQSSNLLFQREKFFRACLFRWNSLDVLRTWDFFGGSSGHSPSWLVSFHSSMPWRHTLRLIRWMKLCFGMAGKTT